MNYKNSYSYKIKEHRILIILFLRFSEIGDDTNWTAVIVKRLLRILRTHVFKVDVDHFTNHIISLVNNEETDVDSYKFEGSFIT